MILKKGKKKKLYLIIIKILILKNINIKYN